MSKAVPRDREFDKEGFANLLIDIIKPMTQKQFAQECGLNPAYLNRLIKMANDNPPTPSTIRKIANFADSEMVYDQLLKYAGYSITAMIDINRSEKPIIKDKVRAFSQIAIERLKEKNIEVTNCNIDTEPYDTTGRDSIGTISLKDMPIDDYVIIEFHKPAFHYDSKELEWDRLLLYLVKLSKGIKRKTALITDNTKIFTFLTEQSAESLNMHLAATLIDRNDFSPILEKPISTALDPTPDMDILNLGIK